MTSTASKHQEGDGDVLALLFFLATVMLSTLFKSRKAQQKQKKMCS